MKKIIPWLIAGVVVLIAIFFLIKNYSTKSSSPTTATQKQNAIRVGFSMDTLKEDRWKVDRDLFTQKVEALGGSVVTLIANGDDQLQVSQIENLIAQKVNVLVIIPHNGKAVSPVIAKAHEQNIKVISYDRLINDADVDLYVSFDNEKVGQFQAQGVVGAVGKGNFAYVGGAPTDNNVVMLKQGAMKVLNPKITSGEIKLVFDQPTDDWKPELAYQHLKTFLATGAKVDAVVAANDGVAYGAIRALQEKGLAGKVPVSGQDAELGACQRIVQGLQTVTVYKPIKLLASSAAEAAMELAEGKTVNTNSKINNNKIDVPSLLLEPILVNKSNMDSTVIADGFHTKDEIYKTQ